MYKKGSVHYEFMALYHMTSTEEMLKCSNASTYMLLAHVSILAFIKRCTMGVSHI